MLRPANNTRTEPGAIQYKECPWDERYQPPHGTSFSTFFGPEYQNMPALKRDEPKWIPAPTQRHWKEGCKPDRIFSNIWRFSMEMPDRVSEAHVKAYKDWLAAEDAADEMYDLFVWPVPKSCPMPNDRLQPRRARRARRTPPRWRCTRGGVERAGRNDAAQHGELGERRTGPYSHTIV